MDKTSFIISYDGIALRDHIMDVKDLAPALLAIGQVFDEANRSINNNKIEIKLQVKALNAGSFEVFFDLVQGFSDQIKTLFSGGGVSSILNFKELIFGTGGLLWLIKELKGEKPDKIEDQQNGNVRLTFKRETIIIDFKLLRLYQDIAVRESIEKILTPLKENGIDSFSAKSENEELVRIEKDEIKYFALPAIEDEIVNESEHQSAYSIVSLAFKDDNKWRLHDGNSTIYATIKDEMFIKKVDQNLISFTKGGVLLCKVKTTQWKTGDGLKTEHEVLEVISHKPASRQIKLEIETEKNDL